MNTADLIARLEQANGPDRNLGHEVLRACGWRQTQVGYWLGPIYYWSSPDGKHSFPEDGMPCPTKSVDMALRLVPPHHLWQLKQGIEAQAVVWMLETDYDERNPPTGYSTTFPAIALCIAALRARAERERHAA